MELTIAPEYVGMYASSGNNTEATIISVRLNKISIKNNLKFIIGILNVIY